MTTIELLQQLGLNKYEAEAYYALLTHGALTGYEVGKRSQVPLSRSYEILERLTEKGLALVQPADPPRYTAQAPQHFLGHYRSNMEAILNTLATELAALAQPHEQDNFWVVRGQQNIVEQARNMIAEAQTTLELTAPSDWQRSINEVLGHARQRGCRIFQATQSDQGSGRNILLLCDGRLALVGTLSPTSQTVVSANSALLTALSGYFELQYSMETALISARAVQQADWLDWEGRKQRHLWELSTEHRVA